MQFTNYDLRITIFYESFIQEITKWNRGNTYDIRTWNSFRQVMIKKRDWKIFLIPLIFF